MDETEDYPKARRNLILFSGLLGLSLLVGFKEKAEGSLLPFTLEKPEAIPDILCVVVIYQLYNYMIQWFMSDDVFRSKNIRKIDFLLVTFVGFVTLVPYLWLRFPTLWANLAFAQSAISTVGVIAIAAILSAMSFLTIRSLKKRQADNAAETERQLREILIQNEWILHVDPRDPAAKKVIGFNADGSIKNANENENRWRFNSTFLEILNSKGQVFSRFGWYDTPEKKLRFSDDPDLLATPGQYLVAQTK